MIASDLDDAAIGAVNIPHEGPEGVEEHLAEVRDARRDGAGEGAAARARSA